MRCKAAPSAGEPVREEPTTIKPAAGELAIVGPIAAVRSIAVSSAELAIEAPIAECAAKQSQPPEGLPMRNHPPKKQPPMSLPPRIRTSLSSAIQSLARRARHRGLNRPGACQRRPAVKELVIVEPNAECAAMLSHPPQSLPLRNQPPNNPPPKSLPSRNPTPSALQC